MNLPVTRSGLMFNSQYDGEVVWVSVKLTCPHCGQTRIAREDASRRCTGCGAILIGRGVLRPVELTRAMTKEETEERLREGV